MIRFSARALLSVALALIAALASAAAGGQDFPTRPIRIVVPQAPGSSPDVLARVLGQKLNTLRDFAPVTQATNITIVLVANPSLPVKTAQELAVFARARPGQLNYSSPGVGNLMHLAAELFSQQTGVKMAHIPNKGDTPAVLDAITGQAAVMFSSLPSVVTHIKSGRLRLLAVCGEKRSAAFESVPTIAEAGILGVVISGWLGVIAPAGTPPDVVNKLYREIARVLFAPEVKQNLTAQGAEPVGSTPEQFTAFIKTEQAKWGKVIRESGIRLNQ